MKDLQWLYEMRACMNDSSIAMIEMDENDDKKMQMEQIFESFMTSSIIKSPRTRPVGPCTRPAGLVQGRFYRIYTIFYRTS